MNSFNDYDVSILKEKFICKICGNKTSLSGECEYCKNLNDDFMEEFMNFRIMLYNNMNHDIQFDLNSYENFIFLYKLNKNITDKIINNFFENQKIEFKIQDFINKLNKKIENYKALTHDENVILKSILINKLTLDTPFNVTQVQKCHIMQKKVLEYNTFCELIKYDVEEYLNLLTKNIKSDEIKAKFKIRKMEELGVFSVESFNVILDDNEIYTIFEGGEKCIHAYSTLFHELQHADQEAKIRTGKINRDIIKTIKEKIIKELSSEHYYYKNNYDLIGYEKDAEANSYIYTLKYFKLLGISIAQETIDKVKNYINGELLKYKNELRNIKDDFNFEEDELSIDEIFEYYIKNNPQYLKIYPQLQLEYMIEENKVRKKNFNELVNTMLYSNLNHDELQYLLRKIMFLKNEQNSKVNKKIS